MSDTEHAVDSAAADQRNKDLSTETPAPSSGSALSMEDRKEWPLGDREVAHLKLLQRMYNSKHVNLKPTHLLETEEYPGWTIAGKYYKAKNPLRSKDFDMASVDSSCAGFLLEFVDSCLIPIRDFKLRYLENYRHHPVALVVNEFHHFAMYLATVSAPEQAIKEKIGQRIELIGAFANGTQQSGHVSLTSMMYYSEWLILMMKIREVLDDIHGRWDVFLEQQTIQEQLNRMSSELTMVVKKILIYQLYVLNGRHRDFAFDPSRPSLRDVPEHNLAEGLVYMVINNELVCEALNVSLEGGWDKLSHIFERLKLPIPDPNTIQTEPLPEIRQYIEEAHETGLASKYVIHEGSVEETEFGVATEKWLNLLPKIVGVAGCVNMIRHAHRISGLGGELLMAKHANKQVANAIFDFVENCLTAVLHDVKDLQKVLTGVSGRGSSSRAQRVLASTGYRNGEFEQWKENFSFSGSSYEAITQYICNLLKNLASLKTRVNTLKVEAVERKIRNEGGQLLKCIGSLFKQFDQWNGSKITLPESQIFCMPSVTDSVATDVDLHGEVSTSLAADTLTSISSSGPLSLFGSSRVNTFASEASGLNTIASEASEEAPKLWSLRKKMTPVLPSGTTPSMQFRADMAAAMGVAPEGNNLETSASPDCNLGAPDMWRMQRTTNKTEEEKTLTMQYQEALTAPQTSHVSEADLNGIQVLTPSMKYEHELNGTQPELRTGEVLTDSMKYEHALNNCHPSRLTPTDRSRAVPPDKRVQDDIVGQLTVSITDRRSEASFGSQAQRPKQKRCPRGHDLDTSAPSGFIALLHPRVSCDECGLEITRRAKRIVCLQCPSNAAIRWCGQAPGYTRCMACAQLS